MREALSFHLCASVRFLGTGRWHSLVDCGPLSGPGATGGGSARAAAVAGMAAAAFEARAALLARPHDGSSDSRQRID